MAVLKSDGEINYRSIGEFLADYQTHISKGGLYLDTEADWPLRKIRAFTVRVEETESRLEIRAEVVFLGENKVGLHVLPDEKDRLETFRNQIQTSGKSSPTGDPTQAPQSDEADDGQKTPLETTGQIVVPGNLDEFRTVTPLEPGDPGFRTITLFRLVASVAAAHTAVALTIRHKGKSLCFRFNHRGNLVQFLGPGAGEDLLKRLVNDRLITRHVEQQVLAELSEQKVAEAILLERKVIKLADLWEAVRNQAIDALEQVRSISGATYRLDLIKTGRRTGVTFGALIVPWMERALKKLDPAQFEMLLEPIWNHYPVVQEDSTWPVSSLAIRSKGSRFVDEYLDGNRTLSEAIEIFPLSSREQALSTVIILTALGLLEIHDRARDSDEEADPETHLDLELEELAKKNRFVQAGVHWSAHVDDFPAALQKLERKYGPDGKLAGFSEQTANLCQARLDMARQAQSFLQNRANRTQHRREVVGEYQMQNSAELLFKQAQLRLLKQEVRKARQLLEIAIELDPQQEYIDKLNSI